MIYKNLIIGTANFGQQYGVIQKKKIKLSQVKKIIDFANQKKIKFFDNSLIYKNYEKILGKNITKNSSIVLALYLTGQFIGLKQSLDLT